MNPKRPIDALRDSGGSMDIGTKAEGAITDLISTAEALYIVKERSVYAVQTADQIDPGRTNPVIPNTQQRVLAIGSESPIVVRTLLTGQTLFKKTMLGKEFDEQSAIGLALGLLKDLAAMDDVRSSLEEAERLARASYEKESNRNRSALPSLGDCKARLDAYAQKAGHVVNCLEEISKLFYGKSISVKWIDSLSRLVEAKHGKEHGFSKYLAGAKPFLLFVLDMRNMIEHPRPEKRIEVDDYKLLASGEINSPSFKMVRSGEDATTGSLIALMRQITEDLIAVAEVLMGHLCNANVQPFADLPIQVVELPEEQRANKLLRLSYGFYQGDQIVRFG